MAHSVCGLVVRETAVGEELRQEVGGTFDRSGNQLRKERDKGKEGDDVSGRFYFFAIDVYRVTEGLEGLERNADGKDDFQQQAIRADTKLGDKEVVILEEREDSKIKDDICYHPRFGFMRRGGFADKQATAP